MSMLTKTFKKYAVLLAGVALPFSALAEDKPENDYSFDANAKPLTSSVSYKKDAQVEEAQRLLHKLGHKTGKTKTPDGKKGDLTNGAIEKFLEQNGIDNRINIDTLIVALKDAVAKQNTPAAPTAVASSSTPEIASWLNLNETNMTKDAEIATIQEHLKTLKYYRGTIDGQRGNGTNGAIKKFMAKQNMHEGPIAKDLLLLELTSAVTASQNAGYAASGLTLPAYNADDVANGGPVLDASLFNFEPEGVSGNVEFEATQIRANGNPNSDLGKETIALTTAELTLAYSISDLTQAYATGGVTMLNDQFSLGNSEIGINHASESGDWSFNGSLGYDYNNIPKDQVIPAYLPAHYAMNSNLSFNDVWHAGASATRHFDEDTKLTFDIRGFLGAGMAPKDNALFNNRPDIKWGGEVGATFDTQLDADNHLLLRTSFRVADYGFDYNEKKPFSKTTTENVQTGTVPVTHTGFDPVTGEPYTYIVQEPVFEDVTTTINGFKNHNLGNKLEMQYRLAAQHEGVLSRHDTGAKKWVVTNSIDANYVQNRFGDPRSEASGFVGAASTEIAYHTKNDRWKFFGATGIGASMLHGGEVTANAAVGIDLTHLFQFNKNPAPAPAYEAPQSTSAKGVVANVNPKKSTKTTRSDYNNSARQSSPARKPTTGLAAAKLRAVAMAEKQLEGPKKKDDRGTEFFGGLVLKIPF